MTCFALLCCCSDPFITKVDKVATLKLLCYVVVHILMKAVYVCIICITAAGIKVTWTSARKQIVHRLSVQSAESSLHVHVI